MEHTVFGKVVAALRKEQISFHSGQTWSQQDLAIESGLTPRIVGRIERGEQARLDGDVLGSLATAFNLTSLERREFFCNGNRSGGSGDREKRFVRQRGVHRSMGVVEQLVCTCISDRSVFRYCWCKSVTAFISQHKPTGTSIVQVNHCWRQQSWTAVCAWNTHEEGVGSWMEVNRTRQRATMESRDVALSSYDPISSVVQRAIEVC